MRHLLLALFLASSPARAAPDCTPQGIDAYGKSLTDELNQTLSQGGYTQAEVDAKIEEAKVLLTQYVLNCIDQWGHTRPPATDNPAE